WVITGSKFSAYENHRWIAKLEDFIRACRDGGHKMIGICFGHQMIAQALGGSVVKSDKGWGLGVHRYSTSRWPDALAPAPADLRLQAFHQDQVSRTPPGAITIANSDFCENAALWYPGFALTVQGHPEMPKSYARALLDLRRELFGEISADAAMKDAGRETSRAALALFIRDHLNAI
ncbi:MAG: type 1 glutamine amidotransferase, partial [Paracoccaceae bacterium]